MAICCPMCAKDDIVGHPSMTETLLSCLLLEDDIVIHFSIAIS